MRGWAAFVGSILLSGACTHPPPRAAPEPDDYVFPSARPGTARLDEARLMETGWRHVLAGETAAAERDFRKLLSSHPGELPAETGLAYARLRAGAVVEAGSGFEAVLARGPDYVPALMGAARVAVRRGDLDRALSLYRRAQSIQPDDPTSRRRVGEVKLRLTERRVQAAQVAVAAGDKDTAIAAYRLALEVAPEVAGLRVALADLLLEQGEAEGAVEVLWKDPVGDRLTRLRLAEMLNDRGDHVRALEALDGLLARDPRDAEAQRRVRETREALSLERLPEEYRRIPAAPRVSRAELAALISVNVTALARLPPGEPRVAVDVSTSWAKSHIIRLLALDVMDLNPNHTFEPRGTVRRGDLARAAARVLDLLHAGANPGPAPTDIAPTSLLFDAAVRAVGAGLMALSPDGAFEPGRAVTGREAMDVVEGLGRVSGP